MVNKIPIQQAIIPIKTNKAAQISNPTRIKMFFETTVKLAWMASIAFRFPKMINGMVRKVKNETT